MDLNFSRKRRPASQSEDWLEDLCRRIPPAFSNEPHVGGPGDEFLQQIATSRRKPSLLDPRIAHVSRCPFCLRRIFELREAKPISKVAYRWPAWTLAGLVCAGLLVIVLSRSFRSRQNTEVAVTSQTLDLTLHGTARGSDPSMTPVIRLPRSVDRLRVILPLFSDGGAYSVKVLKERNESSITSEGSGTAVSQGEKTILSIQLDLRTAKPGIYFLSTTHGTRAASYYYPIEVVR